MTVLTDSAAYDTMMVLKRTGPEAFCFINAVTFSQSDIVGKTPSIRWTHVLRCALQQRRRSNGGRFAMSKRFDAETGREDKKRRGFSTAWEVDWSHEQNTGTLVWARNPKSRIPSGREWHWVTTGYLREVGVRTPVYRADSWEIDWSKRKGKLAWGRNPASKMPSSREWHWIDHHTLDRANIPWKPYGITGRHINGTGYVVLTRRGMTDEEIRLAEDHGLFKGKSKTTVWEHQLVAVKKYGAFPRGMLIRHMNGDKTDNRPENLVLGTTKENAMDHKTACLMAMFWREKYEEAAKEIARLQKQVNDWTAFGLVERILA